MKISTLTCSVLVMMCLVAPIVGQSKPPGSALSLSEKDKKPDLIPILNSPMDSEIRVKNVGDGPADSSKLTLDCVRLGAPSQMYSCPNLPVSVAPLYFDEAFPNNATIKVPALAPGEIFVHKLSFWDLSNWPKGKYKFTVTVDAAHQLTESNPDNNVATRVLIIR